MKFRSDLAGHLLGESELKACLKETPEGSLPVIPEWQQVLLNEFKDAFNPKPERKIFIIDVILQEHKYSYQEWKKSKRRKYQASQANIFELTKIDKKNCQLPKGRRPTPYHPLLFSYLGSHTELPVSWARLCFPLQIVAKQPEADPQSESWNNSWSCPCQLQECQLDNAVWWPRGGLINSSNCFLYLVAARLCTQGPEHIIHGWEATRLPGKAPAQSAGKTQSRWKRALSQRQALPVRLTLGDQPSVLEGESTSWPRVSVGMRNMPTYTHVCMHAHAHIEVTSHWETGNISRDKSQKNSEQ